MSRRRSRSSSTRERGDRRADFEYLLAPDRQWPDIRESASRDNSSPPGGGRLETTGQYGKGMCPVPVTGSGFGNTAQSRSWSETPQGTKADFHTALEVRAGRPTPAATTFFSVLPGKKKVVGDRTKRLETDRRELQHPLLADVPGADRDGYAASAKLDAEIQEPDQ